MEFFKKFAFWFILSAICLFSFLILLALKMEGVLQCNWVVICIPLIVLAGVFVIYLALLLIGYIVIMKLVNGDYCK